MLLARYGVQLSFEDAWIVFCVFDARFLHGARNVCIHPENKSVSTPTLVLDPETFRNDPNYIELQRLYAAADKVKRAAFVCYFPHQAVFRTGNYAVTPSVNFGNTGTLSKADMSVKPFAGDGEFILGSEAQAKTRMARELAFGFFNGLSQIGCKMPGMSAQSLLAYVGYEDPCDSQQLLPVLPLQSDVLNPNQTEFIQQQRHYLSYYYHLRKSLQLNIDQKEFFSHQDDLLKSLRRLNQNPEHQAKRPSDLRQGVSIQSTASGQSSTDSSELRLSAARTITNGKGKGKETVPLPPSTDKGRGLSSRLISGGPHSMEMEETNITTGSKRAASPANSCANEDGDRSQSSGQLKKKQKTHDQTRGAVGPVSFFFFLSKPYVNKLAHNR